MAKRVQFLAGGPIMMAVGHGDSFSTECVWWDGHDFKTAVVPWCALEIIPDKKEDKDYIDLLNRIGKLPLALRRQFEAFLKEYNKSATSV